MSEDILKKAAEATDKPAPAPKENKLKHRISVMAVLLTILLSIVLVIFGERIIYDLNRTFNPVVVEQEERDTKKAGSIAGYGSEQSLLSASRVYYPQENESEYTLYRMLIHAAFVIPAFLLMFVLYFWIWHRKSDSPYKIVVIGYLAFAFWMMLHLIFEAAGYVLEEYKNIGVYLILGFLAIMFTWLMIVLQKRVNKNRHG